MRESPTERIVYCCSCYYDNLHRTGQGQSRSTEERRKHDVHEDPGHFQQLTKRYRFQHSRR